MKNMQDKKTQSRQMEVLIVHNFFFFLAGVKIFITQILLDGTQIEKYLACICARGSLQL